MASLDECVSEAEGDFIVVEPGWSPLIGPDGSIAIFLCRNEESCPGDIVGGGNGTNCTVGYSGVLCGSCATDYVLKPDGSCTQCGQTSPAGAAALIISLLIAIWAIKCKLMPTTSLL